LEAKENQNAQLANIVLGVVTMWLDRHAMDSESLFVKQILIVLTPAEVAADVGELLQRELFMRDPVCNMVVNFPELL
jgi:hypothetical protein